MNYFHYAKKQRSAYLLCQVISNWPSNEPTNQLQGIWEAFFLVKKFLALRAKRRFITVFIRAHHLSLPCARSTQIQFLYRGGVHKFYKHLEVTSKFQAREGWHEANLHTKKSIISGVTAHMWNVGQHGDMAPVICAPVSYPFSLRLMFLLISRLPSSFKCHLSFRFSMPDMRFVNFQKGISRKK